MDAIVRDVRYAWRVIIRAPLTSGAAVATLALGIGATSAIFSVVNAALLTPLPGIADPDRVVIVGRTYDGSGFDNSSYPNYVDLRDQNHAFTDVAAATPAALSLSVDDRAERRAGALVTPNYFRTLGVTFALGHAFDISPLDRQSGPPVAVIGHGVWLQQFGRDPGVIGRTISLNGRLCEIVGVTAAGFRGADATAPQDIWVPTWTAGSLEVLPRSWRQIDLFRNREAVWIKLYARLRPGLDLAQARTDVQALATRLRAYPENAKNGWDVAPGAGLEPDDRRELMRVMTMLFGAVAVLLLLACANVANLSLARAAARVHELTVRLAVGASRSRLVRQLLTESLLLAILGGAGGVIVAWAATEWLSTLFADSARLPLAMDLSPDARVVLFTLAVSGLTALVFGVGPALRSSKVDLVPALKDAAAIAPRRTALRRALVAAQLTLSIVLLIAAGLFLRTLRAFNAIDTGVNASNVTIGTIEPWITGRYDESRLRQFYMLLLPRVQAIRGVEAATLGRIAPVTPRGYGVGATIPDKPGSFAETRGLQFNTVATNYFDVLGIRVLRGRGFRETDAAASMPVVVVNEVAARRLWPGEDPLRKQIWVRGEPVARQVVGVVAAIKYRNLIETPYPLAYFPLSQPVPMPEAPIVLHVRSRLPTVQLEAALSNAVQALDPALPVFNVKRLSDHMADSYWRQRIVGTVTKSLGILALALGSIGMYGVMAFAAATRTREIGVRMALGATAGEIVRLFVWDAARLVGVATATGIALALGMSRLVAAMLFGVDARDPLTFAVAAGVLGAAGLFASAAPAIRASRVDPMLALRRD